VLAFRVASSDESPPPKLALCNRGLQIAMDTRTVLVTKAITLMEPGTKISAFPQTFFPHRGGVREQLCFTAPALFTYCQSLLHNGESS